MYVYIYFICSRLLDIHKYIPIFPNVNTRTAKRRAYPPFPSLLLLLFSTLLHCRLKLANSREACLSLFLFGLSLYPLHHKPIPPLITACNINE
ncbi:hypothetical protein M441DRAFT_269013 [Trichoderma asperellum CBS 433.97]|uniref:Uncharacterized protein n=1 Tax=Trichoderma asperellum (strain ATCC 204424 / CBS 433.97 / NBRC 101777) TaxID=1042311 RepID=A0A2T3YW20_TRIA4|nr:hypothetical protein M441DRAFT_269013 [Trichoderma asperellum CBS 433.97]PTB36761.1 hypothetical protein M441DRAFT_269013 [Trichoderma asperellum CBS 433.97]